ncbi:hypothetical protein H4N58_08155 [Mumia sp. ZJ1417]|uniref:hypothetical protein n=1 Tax=Mumia sp. ZJ1417 TaxID=2708082 RepID=UPI00141D8986|nr:hypothetical protein [Mumia sp. ZJ1417]QMW67817.1 hypothetical protein H4N58_08155 [Mumia sp. ZJ1417]
MGRRLLGNAWPWVMALLVCAPMLASGYVLSYDMVFVPRLDITRPDVWGLGSATPRAVPSDAVVAVANLVVPGWLLQKVVLVGSLVAAGAGAMRMLGRFGLGAQLAGTTWFVWNPYVAERLVIGHWPLLVAYAALPWLVVACLEVREGGTPRWWRWVVPLAATALSPASGVIGAVLAVSVCGWRRCGRVALVAVVVNLPWIVAGFAHAGAGRSDPAGVAVFALQPEAGLGRLGAALSLGGIWNVDVVPDSRDLVTATLFCLVLWTVMAVGAVTAWRGGPAREPVRALVPAAVIALAIALVGAYVPAVLEWVVEVVPGGGLLRDGARYLALLAPLQAVLVAAGVAALAGRVRDGFARTSVLVVAVLLPIAVMPDLAWGAAGRLEAVSYPAEWDEARAAIADSDAEGDLVSLPFGAFRAPAWNDGRVVLDPAGRYFPRETVVDDELVVSGTVVGGEDARAAAVREALASDDPAATLRAEGIGLVVVALDAFGADDLDELQAELEPLFTGEEIAVYEVPSDAR